MDKLKFYEVDSLTATVVEDDEGGAGIWLKVGCSEPLSGNDSGCCNMMLKPFSRIEKERKKARIALESLKFYGTYAEGVVDASGNVTRQERDPQYVDLTPSIFTNAYFSEGSPYVAVSGARWGTLWYEHLERTYSTLLVGDSRYKNLLETELMEPRLMTAQWDDDDKMYYVKFSY